jgi:hypothetical protein
MNLKVCGFGAILAAAIAVPAALAHHSFAMFDATKTVVVKGTVKEYEWVNPHVWIRLMIPDQATGKLREWAFEARSPGTLSKLGMTPTTMKPGDVITLSYNPMKDGSRGGQFLQALLPNGELTVSRPGAGPDLLKYKE